MGHVGTADNETLPLQQTVRYGEPSGDVGKPRGTGAAFGSKRSTRDIPEPNESFSALVRGGSDTTGATGVGFAVKGCLRVLSKTFEMWIFLDIYRL